MLEFLDSNYLGVQGVLHHSENLSIQYQEQKFCIKFAFSEEHWTACSMKPIKKCKKKDSIWACLIKMSISALNFSTESAKKPTVSYLLLLISLYSDKIDSKRPSEMRN